MQHAYAIGFGIGAAVSVVLIIVSIATVSWLIVEERDEITNEINRTRQVGLFLVCTEESCESEDGKLSLHIAVQWGRAVAYAGFFNGGVSVTSHRDDVSFSDVTAIIMP